MNHRPVSDGSIPREGVQAPATAAFAADMQPPPSPSRSSGCRGAAVPTKQQQTSKITDELATSPAEFASGSRDAILPLTWDSPMCWDSPVCWDSQTYWDPGSECRCGACSPGSRCGRALPALPGCGAERGWSPVSSHPVSLPYHPAAPQWVSHGRLGLVQTCSAGKVV